MLLYRLNDEYKLDVKLERLPLSVARWPIDVKTGERPKAINGGVILYRDTKEQPVVLLQKEWDLNWLIKENPNLEFGITGR